MIILNAILTPPHQIDEDVLLGYPSGRLEAASPLRLGPHARLRSGTVLYAGTTIGSHLETGHHVIIREETEIGDHCCVWSGAYVGYGCRLGSGVTIHCHCYIAQYTEIGEGAFIAPGCAFADDKYPGSQFGSTYMKGPILEPGVQLGVNVSVLPEVRIGARSVIGAGSVVTRDIPPESVAYGNPARVWGRLQDLTGRPSRPAPPYPG
jgi:acetyltransferase-like isoleucine patch superfamily enzyme